MKSHQVKAALAGGAESTGVAKLQHFRVDLSSSEKKGDETSKRNGGTPKSSIVIGFSIINHPFLGTPIYGNPHM